MAPKEILKKVVLFKYLSPSEMDALENKLVQRQIAKGTLVKVDVKDGALTFAPVTEDAEVAGTKP
jgi:hypothetical protein